MDSEAADLTFQVDRYHLVALVLCGIHIRAEALLFQVRNGAADIVGLYSQMTVAAQIHGLHDLNTAADKGRAVAI